MASERKVGRKLIGEGWSPETLKQVHRWFNTPKNRRQPRTTKEFAEQLGMHRNTLYNLHRQPVEGFPNKYWGSLLERDQERLQRHLPKQDKTVRAHSATTSAITQEASTANLAETAAPEPEGRWYSEDDVPGDILLNSEESRQWVIAELRRRKGQPVTWTDYMSRR